MAEELFEDPRLTAMGVFVEVAEGLTAKMSRVFAEQGLFGMDFDALIRLARSPGQRLRMTDLAAQTSLSPSGVTRLVDRLEGEGLIRREASSSDRRASFAVLTDAGRQRLKNVLPPLLDNIDRWFTGQLSPEQLDALLTGLRLVRAAVRPGANAAGDD